MFFTGYLSSTGCILCLCPGLEVPSGPCSAYLRDPCYLTLGTRGSSSLRSMERGILFVPIARTSTRQTCSFSVVGRSVWNGLLLALRLFPKVHYDAFNSSLKTAPFSRDRVGSASE